MNWQSSKDEAADLQARDEPGKRDFRRIGHPAEHAFAEKRPAELHAVESADQLGAVPDFDRMGVARRMKRQHRAFDVGVDPGLLAVRAGAQSPQESHGLSVTVKRPDRIVRAQRLRQMEAVERDDRPRSAARPRTAPRRRGCRPWGRSRRHSPAAAGAGRVGSSAWNMGRFQQLVRLATGSRAPRPAGGTGGRPCRSRPADG